VPDQETIGANLARVRENIAGAARRAGRDPGDVCLVAVTKLVPPELVALAVRAGVRDLGENRVQEGVGKRQALETVHPDLGAAVRWHLIGHLQTNKAARAVAHFDLLHSVDSLRVAEAISAAILRGRPAAASGDRPAAASGDRPAAILVQVNMAGEATKSGAPPAAIAGLVRDISRLPGLSVQGLMTIAPLAADAEDVRPVFRRVTALAREIDTLGLPGVGMELLSMGMSQDYEVAISEGANVVRIGMAVFGPRGG
jgi:hypothetical protein